MCVYFIYWTFYAAILFLNELWHLRALAQFFIIFYFLYISSVPVFPRKSYKYVFSNIFFKRFCQNMFLEENLYYIFFIFYMYI